MTSPRVDTVYGPVRGIDDGTAMSFKGVRYAAPPVGELRFRAPEPPQPWTEPATGNRVRPAPARSRRCRTFRSISVPPRARTAWSLNVWAPSGTAPGDAKPVMVWVHGGAYVLGSGSQPLYDGRRLASRGDVVVVTLQLPARGLRLPRPD